MGVPIIFQALGVFTFKPGILGDTPGSEYRIVHRSEVVVKPLCQRDFLRGLPMIPGGGFPAALSLVLSIKLLAALLFCLYPGATRFLFITLYPDLCFQQYT